MPFLPHKISPMKTKAISPNTPKKPRNDAKLLSLTKGRKDEIARWFKDENVSYDEAIARCKKLWGISTSAAAMTNFWRQYARDPAIDADRLAAIEARLQEILGKLAELDGRLVTGMPVEIEARLDALRIATVTVGDAVGLNPATFQEFIDEVEQKRKKELLPATSGPRPATSTTPPSRCRCSKRG